MADKWRHSTVGNEVDILLGYAFKSAEFFTELPGTRLVRGDNVKRGFIEWGDKARFWRTITPDLERYALREGDIVIGMDGSRVGENFARVSASDLPAFLVQRVACLRARSEIYQGFLRYVICNPNFTAYIKAVHTGTSIPHISGGQIAAYPVSVPPLREQQAIACILGALDDKIELNRRRNETLEGMARALFQSWFVDFDPVRAKAAGRTLPGLKPELAALFPDTFVESPLGQIPEGWLLRTVGDVADINIWTLGKKDELEEIDYIEISEVMRGEVGTISRYLRGSEPGRARRRLRHGDTAISTVRPDRGAYFLAIDPPPSLVASTGFAVMTAKDGQWAFVHLLTTRSEFGEELGRLADGGAYPAVRPELISAQTAVLPSNKGILDGFEKIVQSMFLSSESSRQESKMLSAVRDAILPKLVTGELRVSNAETIVGRIT